MCIYTEGRSFFDLVASAVRTGDGWWEPIAVRLEPNELAGFRPACERAGLTLVDTIARQLGELAQVRFPAVEQRDERERFVREIVTPQDAVTYGLWICFPWDRQVVHLLPPDEYFDVITDRNRDKITREELLRLRAKTVGVMGLSVGAEVAVTLAQEHLCGSIRLADFDRLDLSNLNRISAGCNDLGVPKTTIAGRRITKIDPYLKIGVYDGGVTQENAGAFLDGLDLLVEECDGLQMKWDIRLLAKAKEIDIVYAGDERGFLSVEPYGSSPALAPFHGRIINRPLARNDYVSQRDFLTALSEWLGGWDALSARSRESLGAVGTRLSGYPQLASEARFAAGQIAHVSRRLLLGERVPASLGWYDLTELVPR